MVGVKTGFAKGGVDNGRAVGAVFQAAGFGFGNDPAQIPGLHHRAGAGIGHQAAAAQDAPQLADFGHNLRRRQAHLKIQPAALNAGDQVVIAHIVGPGLAGNFRALAAGKDQHPDLLAQAVRQHGHIPHHLVGVARVGAGSQVDFHRLVELGVSQFFEQVDGFPGGVRLIRIHPLGDFGVAAAVLGHRFNPLPRRCPYCGRCRR